MSKTYAQVMKQIDHLKAEAERLRKQEINGVVERIREAIQFYNLSAADLGLGRGHAKPGPKAGAAKGRKRVLRRRGGAAKVAKYRDENGNTWAGRGKRPIWLHQALAAGRTLEEFAVK
ncbi:MAG: H-NS histone family protein [Burkholderiales bacterium]|nr:H-NS histone family protein [Burkholderiales bacterium]